ncbi:cytochrome P450 [Kitasatospora sp. NPDC059646]|uniref:cytochrome P450 n=1 Tax=Kitasatospora sp. NPDC059646 TaxID=3346893 RepID=UPI0036980F8F
MDSLRHELTRFIQQPTAQQDPPALCRRLPAEAPVPDLGPLYVVSGHQEILTVLTHPGATVDPTTVGLPRAGSTALLKVVNRMLPMRDGADHARLKRLATTAFGHRRPEQTRERIETAARLPAPLVAAGPFELVADLAVPLPVAVSCAVLDVPDSEHGRITGWASLVARSLRDPFGDGPEAAVLDAEFAEFRCYVEELCAQRAARPGDDLISRLAAARDQGGFDAEELLAFAVMLLANGLETLTAGLAVAARELIRAPGPAGRVRDEPAPAAAVFDEARRLGSPVRAAARALAREVVLGDTTVPAASVAMLLYAAADRDPRRFPAPDRFDPDRPERRHLAFGHGPHHRLGTPLSLIAGAAVLRGLAEADAVRRSGTTPTESTARRHDRFAFRGIRELPVGCPPRATLAGAAA